MQNGHRAGENRVGQSEQPEVPADLQPSIEQHPVAEPQHGPHKAIAAWPLPVRHRKNSDQAIERTSAPLQGLAVSIPTACGWHDEAQLIVYWQLSYAVCIYHKAPITAICILHITSKNQIAKQANGKTLQQSLEQPQAPNHKLRPDS